MPDESTKTVKSHEENDEDFHNSPGHPVNASTENFPTYNYAQPFNKSIATGELTVGAIGISLWITVFLMGLFISTSNMRAALGAGPMLQSLGFTLLVGLSYTLTNVLFLSCLASLLGCMAHRWQVDDSFNLIPPNAESVDATRIYVAAVLRGFFLYLMFISGFLLVSTKSNVTQTDFDQYIRIAGMVSILGFIVGYDPNLLVRFIRRILSVAGPLQETSRAASESQPDRNVSGPITKPK